LYLDGWSRQARKQRHTSKRSALCHAALANSFPADMLCSANTANSCAVASSSGQPQGMPLARPTFSAFCCRAPGGGEVEEEDVEIGGYGGGA